MNGIQEVWGSIPHSSIQLIGRRKMQSLIPYFLIPFLLFVVFLILKQIGSSNKRKSRQKKLKIIQRMHEGGLKDEKKLD